MLLEFITIIVALTVCPVLCQHGFPSPITCYTRYQNEETRNQGSNHIINFYYQQAEITNYGTLDGQSCAEVGCACFSYRAVCSHGRLGKNHYSDCTEADRQNRVVQWHRGWSSNTECAQMQQQPQLYQDLTCCYSDKCNDQPGKITKIADSSVPIQSRMPGSYHGSHYGSVVQPTPMYIPNPGNPVPYNPSGYIPPPAEQNSAQTQRSHPQYQTHRTNVYQTRSSTYSTLIQRSPQPTNFYADRQQSYAGNNASILRSISNWCIFLSTLLSVSLLL